MVLVLPVKNNKKRIKLITGFFNAPNKYLTNASLFLRKKSKLKSKKANK